jgi:hypothetical protein
MVHGKLTEGITATDVVALAGAIQGHSKSKVAAVDLDQSSSSHQRRKTIGALQFSAVRWRPCCCSLPSMVLAAGTDQ